MGPTGMQTHERIRAGREIPARINAILSALVVVVHGAALLALPATDAVPTGALVTLIAIAALGTPTHWALIHEAIHGVLLPGRAANERLARVLAILFGVPFRAVRFAHLRHHRYNRTRWGREEVYDPAERSVFAAYVLHYLRITFGLYIGELALSLLCWLPRPILRRHLHSLCPDTSDGTPGMRVVADREVLSASALVQIRVDAIFVLALYGGAFALYGTRWPILVALLVVRGFISSQLDHAPHHGTLLERRDHALNLAAPRWLQRALLNFNFHRVHHRHPHLPWRSLPALADSEPDDISFARAVLRQWRGPIAIDTARTRS
jgi:fatty acid desaturase